MNGMKYKSSAFLTVITVVIASLMAFSVGCVKKEEKEIKIGAILPLTGSAALLGTETKEGIDIAIEEINSASGIKGSPIKVIYHYSQNDPKEGVSAFRVLTDIEKTPVIISSMSSVTKAIIPIANEKKVVLMATVTATPKITELSEWVFRNYYTTDIQGEVLSRFIVNKINIKKVGVLYLNDDYGFFSCN